MNLKFLKPLPLFLAGAVIFMVGISLAIPQPAEAQCGSSASSCKTCHETQGEDPVNNNGDWHTQHAFGDFCEFCHAGNVQATDKEGAHQGLVPPLEDLAASCQSCHPQDLMERGEKYASVLGVELGSGSLSGGNNDSGSSSGGAITGATGISAPLGGEEIDLSLLYTQKTSPSLIKNWGNLILVIMIAGLAAAFFLAAWTWEDWGLTVAGWFNRNFRPVTDAITIADGEGIPPNTQNALATAYNLEHLLHQKPALKEVWDKVSQLDSELLQYLNHLLNDSENGPQLIKAAGRLDSKLVSGIKAMDDKDRILLLNLVKEMN